MSVLNRIRDTLASLKDDNAVPMEGVYYGACQEKELDNWNYFVFNRWKTTKNNQSRTDFQTLYQVHIVHEDYIPEGYVQRVISALEAQADAGTKLKATMGDIPYNYTFKGNTNMVVEIATITLFHPEKRC
jgi:hypothetical protein